MKNERLTKLLEFLEKEPNDPFLLYAVANEHRDSNVLKAKEFYDKLLDEHENYLPTYYHAALLYVDLKEFRKAEEIFKKGLELARLENNELALRELNNAYQNFLFDQSDYISTTSLPNCLESLIRSNAETISAKGLTESTRGITLCSEM